MLDQLQHLVALTAPYAAAINVVLVLVLKAINEFIPGERDFSVRARKVKEDLVERSASALESVLNAIHPRTDNNTDLIAAFTRTTYKSAHLYRRSCVIEQRLTLYKAFFYILIFSIILLVSSLAFPSTRLIIGLLALMVTLAQISILVLLRRSADELTKIESESESK